MKIEISQESETVCHVAMVGAFGNENAEELREQFEVILKKECEEVIFDLTSVPYMTSSSIGKLLIFYKALMAKNGKMRVSGISDSLLDNFRLSKFDRLFPIEQ